MLIALEANVFGILRMTPVEKLGEVYARLIYTLVKDHGLNHIAARFCVDTFCHFLGHEITVSERTMEWLEQKLRPPPPNKPSQKTMGKLGSAIAFIMPVFLIGICLWFGMKLFLQKEVATTITTSEALGPPVFVRSQEPNPVRAVQTRNVVELREALSSGYPADKRDTQNQTLLMQASKLGFSDGVRLLLEFKADVNAQDNLGKTALILAATGGHIEVVRLLCQSGANIYHKDNSGRTALIHSILKQNNTTVQFLSFMEKSASSPAHETKPPSP
jgi:hypothetical protein